MNNKMLHWVLNHFWLLLFPFVAVPFASNLGATHTTVPQKTQFEVGVGAGATSNISSQLPGQQLWQNNVSSFVFGANDASWGWFPQNMGNSPAIRAAVKAAGITVIRAPLTSSDANQRVTAIEQSGAQCLGILSTNGQDAQQVVQQLGQRCNMYELGNEPDITTSASSYSSTWNNIIPQLRQINPHAVFIGPVVSHPDTSYIHDFLVATKAAGNTPDVVSWHMYPCTDQDEQTCLSQGVKSYAQVAQEINGVVTQILGHSLPLAITEWNDNWKSNATSQESNPQFMTQFTTASLQSMMSAGIALATQFDIASNAGGGHLDMISPQSGQPRPQLEAMQTLIQSTQAGQTSQPLQTGLAGQANGAGQATADACFADPTCWLQKAVVSLSQWMAQGLLNIVQPITDRINQGSLNFITHTPVDGTYNNGLIKTFVAFSLSIVDAALAVLVIVGGYNVMIGRHIGARSYEIMELLPRIMLAVIAAHFSLTFVQWFIDLENTMNEGVINLAALTMLTNTLVGLFRLNILQNGWLLFVLVIVLAVMDLLVAWQMLLRLAFLAFLIAVAPLGLLCFALPQSQSWGRLWMNNFVTTVFVQFFQVSILALGGMLVSALVAGTGDLSNLFAFDTDAGKPILTALTSIAVFFLVLKLPGMLRDWALRGVAQQAGSASVEAAQGVASYAADVGVRVLALL